MLCLFQSIRSDCEAELFHFAKNLGDLGDEIEVTEGQVRLLRLFNLLALNL